jgi:DNA uptake protein ComE-like DNA-binding protein
MSQRRVLLALLAVFLVVLCIRFALNHTYVPDPQPPQGARAAELASRVDPNSADWQTLATIPTLGEKRARAIVAYRDRMRPDGSTVLAFQRATDLLHIRGIGAATMENIKPYLIFPADSATTSP